MTTKLAFLGATAFPETQHIIRDLNRAEPRYEVIGLLDDNPALAGTRVAGVEVLGPLALARTLPADVQCVFGIGSHRTRTIRHEILRRIGLPDDRYETIVHPAAHLLPDAVLGPGCIVHPGVIIGQESVLEGFNVVFPHSIVASRNVLGKYAMLTSLVSLTNGVRLGRGVFIGTTSAVAEGVTIGAGAMIGMGTLVHRDVPAGVTAMGNPMRFVHKMEVPPELLDADPGAARHGGTSLITHGSQAVVEREPRAVQHAVA